MEPLKKYHKYIRKIAAEELENYNIRGRLRKLPCKSTHVKNHCYGVDLEHLIFTQVDVNSESIPIAQVFVDLVTFIQKEPDVEGIFRKEGHKIRERELVKVLDNGGKLPQDTSVVEVAAILKVFLRNVPGKLITQNEQFWFMEAGKLHSKMVEALKLCVFLLPLANLYLLVFLMRFFHEITTHSAKNRMTSFNMATVIAPNIFHENVQLNLKERNKEFNEFISVTKVLIENADTLGPIPEEVFVKLIRVVEEKIKKDQQCPIMRSLKSYIRKG